MAVGILGSMTSPAQQHQDGESSRHGSETGEHLRAHVREMLEEVKPRMRGWLHAASAPLTLAACVVLIILSPNAATRVGSSIFDASALELITVSAVYHLGSL